MAKDSHLRNYLEVHSLSSDQVFLSIQLKTFSKFSGWSFKFSLLLNCIMVCLYTYDKTQLKEFMSEVLIQMHQPFKTS